MTVTESLETGVNHVGSRRLRKEDPELLTGEAKFVDDLRLPGALWLGMVRSSEANAVINSIDGSAALDVDGVVEVLTGDDLAPLWGDEGALPCAWPVTDDMHNPRHLPVAIGHARHVGDAVAVVLATSRYAAADGAAAVVVDYDARPAVVDLESAVAEGAALVHEDLGTNEWIANLGITLFSMGRVGEALSALNEGVVGMRPGGKRLLLAPPAFAWGRTGVDSVVPADASVILIVIWCRSRRPSSADGVPAAAARPRLDERLGNRTSTPTAARRVAEVPRAGACDG